MHQNISILKQPSYSCNEERFKNIADWGEAVLRKFGVQSAAIEGYSYGSKGSVFEIGEATGAFKQRLFVMKIPFNIIEPKTAKKHNSGNGNAGKDVLYNAFTTQEEVFIESVLGYDLIDNEAVIRKLETPWELKPVDDIIDSYFIMKCHPDIIGLK
jgi:hypothetical protein